MELDGEVNHYGNQESAYACQDKDRGPDRRRLGRPHGSQPNLQRALPENRGVTSFGDLKNNGLGSTFPAKILLQLLASLRRRHADDVVLGGLVAHGPAKNPLADLLLVNIGSRARERGLADVGDEFPNTAGLL